MINISFSTDEAGVIKVPKDFFESKCILEAASEFTHSYFFAFEVGEQEITIHVSAKNGSVTEEFLGKFANHLIDHQTWRELNKDFGYIRDRIVEQAFAPLRHEKL